MDFALSSNAPTFICTIHKKYLSKDDLEHHQSVEFHHKIENLESLKSESNNEIQNRVKEKINKINEFKSNIIIETKHVICLIEKNLELLIKKLNDIARKYKNFISKEFTWKSEKTEIQEMLTKELILKTGRFQIGELILKAFSDVNPFKSDDPNNLTLDEKKRFLETSEFKLANLRGYYEVKEVRFSRDNEFAFICKNYLGNFYQGKYR